MHYALLIYAAADRPPPADEETMLAGHRALQRDTQAAGTFAAALQLADQQQASTVRVRGDDVLVVDGPFAETKELLLGLYVFACASHEEAVAYAARIPHAAGGGAIELRPLAYYEDRGGT